jgi:hypothetical protein
MTIISRLAAGMMLFFASCHSMKNSESITYIDQNNNLYRITHKSISFRGTKPIQSSTGSYDGGRDKTANLKPKDFKRLKEISKVLMEDKTSHALKREKMTSVVRIDSGKVSEEVILYDSKHRDKMEELLTRIIH